MSACSAAVVSTWPCLTVVTLGSHALARLPVDGSRDARSRQVPNCCFSLVNPTPVSRPTLVAVSKPCFDEILGIDVPSDVASGVHTTTTLPGAAANGSDATAGSRASFAEVFAGNRLLPGSVPAAHCYCGHQFGSFAGQLGDGAAILLGDVVAISEPWNVVSAAATPHSTAAGDNEEIFRRHFSRYAEIQLKGAGPTPYSRASDGRKVLRSSIREFLCSEFMHGLGIPTTRAAAVVTSDDTVLRDPLYTGNAIHERCTVVARVAPSFVRFGSFEICKPLDPDTSDRQGPSAGNLAPLFALFDYTSDELFPQVYAAAALALDAAERSNPILRRRAVAPLLFREVVERTARLVAHWQSVGFTHGVLNTDNMSILGLTIDYGPYGFVSHFDPDYVPNQSDDGGRYSFARQPAMCKWNLERLADCWELLFPDLAEDGTLRRIILESYDHTFDTHYVSLMRRRLGLPASCVTDAEVKRALTALESTMSSTRSDMNTTYLSLAALMDPTAWSRPEARLRCVARITSSCASLDACMSMLSRKVKTCRLSMPPDQVRALLDLVATDPDRVNSLFPGVPVAALMSHLQQEQAKQVKGQAYREELAALRALKGDDERAASNAALWSSTIEGTIVPLLNQIQQSGEKSVAERRELLRNRANPHFILHQWVAQQAIAAAEKNPPDYETTQRLVDRLLFPYDTSEFDDLPAFRAPPAGADRICVSCSS